MLGVRRRYLCSGLTRAAAAAAAGRFNGYGGLGIESTQDYGSISSMMGDALPYAKTGTNQLASKVAAGSQFMCAILTSGVKCWGCVHLPITPARARRRIPGG